MVLNLLKAAYANQKQEIYQDTIVQSVAITHALDLALNKGKMKILTNFQKKLFRQVDEEKGEPKKEYFSDDAFAFFTQKMPRKTH